MIMAETPPCIDIHPVQDVHPNPQQLPDSKPLTKRKRRNHFGKSSAPLSRTKIAAIVDDPLASQKDKNQALARLTNSSPASIAASVRHARERLQARASEYVEFHRDAIVKALAIGEVGEARKGAEWAIGSISAKDADGTIERLIDPPTAVSTAPTIKIGIALGGMSAPSAKPSAG